MKRYEVYQKDKIPPLAIVEAERYYFEDDALIFCNEKNDDDGYDENGELIYDTAYCMAVSALKKQIPKKPDHEGYVAVFNWHNISGFKIVEEI